MPWEKSGSQGGLSTAEGMAFIEALIEVRLVAPLFVGLECVDVITSHEHFPVILMFLRWAGI